MTNSLSLCSYHCQENQFKNQKYSVQNLYKQENKTKQTVPDHKNIVHCKARPTDLYSNVKTYKIKIYVSLLICCSCEFIWEP